MNRHAAQSTASHEVVLTSRQRDNHPYKYCQNVKKHKVHGTHERTYHFSGEKCKKYTLLREEVHSIREQRDAQNEDS